MSLINEISAVDGTNIWVVKSGSTTVSKQKPMSMKRRTIPISTAIIVLMTIVLALSARAAELDPGYQVNWWTVDSGGGAGDRASSGGGYSLSATFAQPDANPQQTMSSDYALTGGFWPTARLRRLFLPVVYRSEIVRPLSQHIFLPVIALNSQGPPPPPSVYHGDFDEGGIPGVEWSSQQVTQVPSQQPGQRFLGPFGTTPVQLSVDDLPPHTQLIITFDLYVIGSWDGNQTSIPVGWGPPAPGLSAQGIVAGTGALGPDQFKLTVDDQLLVHTTFTNWEGFAQSYPGSYLEEDNPAFTGSIARNTLGFWFEDFLPMDSTYRLSYRFPHKANSVTFDFSGTALQSLLDESWGLDNVSLCLLTNDLASTCSD